MSLPAVALAHPYHSPRQEISYKATECGKPTSMFTHTLYLKFTTSCYSVRLLLSHALTAL